MLLTTGDVFKDFEQACNRSTDSTVNYVVIGDAGDTISYENLNAAFRAVIDGAEIIALEKDRYWMAPDGLMLSAGPFVAALEFATGKIATVVGKPSKAFFEMALRDMDVRPDQAAMIGDDIITDIAGARKAGMRAILVKTGKYREEAVRGAPVQPTKIIDSIASIATIL
jgi:HAD superfamily hydrolase (TIGR01458 family)